MLPFIFKKRPGMGLKVLMKPRKHLTDSCSIGSFHPFHPVPIFDLLE